MRANNAAFDFDRDGVLSMADLDYYVRRIVGTTFGDSNVDGRFDSGDLIRVLQAGKYEDQIVGNSTWAEGDWNCDGDFTTSDLVVAFMYGNYDRAAGAVPPEVSAIEVSAAIDGQREVDVTVERNSTSVVKIAPGRISNPRILTTAVRTDSIFDFESDAGGSIGSSDPFTSDDDFWNEV
jgi:hypothetical protein